LDVIHIAMDGFFSGRSGILRVLVRVMCLNVRFRGELLLMGLIRVFS